MRASLAATVAALLLWSAPVHGQAATAQAYTRTVHFELAAPEAKAAYLCGNVTEWKCDALPMRRTGAGVFYVNARLAPGRIEYVFVVDGEARLDEAAPSEDDGKGGRRSWFVLDDDREAQPLEGIPHGTIQQHTLRSAALDDTERFVNVYTPPGYTRSGSYPVLFLLHGFGMDQEQWLIGGIQHYLDRYLAAGLIQPWIVVMPGAPDEFYMGATEEYLVREVYPLVAREYALRTGQGAAAVGGMSMGGFGAFYLAYRHPGLFGHAMILSPGARDTRFLQQLSTELDGGARVLSSLDIRVGQGDEISLPYAEQLHRTLAIKSVPHDYAVTRGGHDWDFWHGVIRPALLEVQEHFLRNPGAQGEATVQPRRPQ